MSVRHRIIKPEGTAVLEPAVNSNVAALARSRPEATSREHLAMNLKLARAMRGWSQEQLGIRCGLKRTYIGALERGEINPGVDNLDRIALGLGVSAHVLLLSPEQAQPTLFQQIRAKSV